MQKILLIKRGLMLGLTLLLVTINAHAQVPGYMGHRFLLQANMEVVPAMLHPNANHATFFKKGGISTYYGLMASFVYSRHRAITASLDYFSTGLNNEMGDTYNYGQANGFYNLKCYTLAIGGRRYKNVAPLGGYFEYAGELSRIDTKLQYYNQQDADYIPSESDRSNRTFDFGFNLGFGYSNIIKKHLVLDFGIKSHFAIIGAFYGTLLGPYADGIGLDNNARVRKGFHSLLMFKMSVGYLF